MLIAYYETLVYILSILLSCSTLSSNESFRFTADPVDSSSIPKVDILTTLAKFIELYIKAVLPWKMKA
jgi:hypothetical protein